MTGRPRVFVTRALASLGPPDPLEPLARVSECSVWEGRGPPEPPELLKGVQDCDGLLCLLTDRVDATVLAACPRLRVISSMSVGVDHIDLAAATARGIPVG